ARSVQADGRAEREEGRRRIGSGFSVTEIPAKGPHASYGRARYPPTRVREQRTSLPYVDRARDRPVRRDPTDAQTSRLGRSDLRKPRNLRDADEHRWAQQRMLHERHERGAAGDDPRVLAARHERGDRVVDRLALDVLKRPKDHRLIAR